MTTKEEIKAMFAREQEDASNYDIKNISEKPNNPGQYTIQIEGVKTIRPLTVNFDGDNWVGLSVYSAMADGDMAKISYYDQKPVKKLKM